jgi:hypothetical protein
MNNANDNAGKPASPERRDLISALAGGAALSILSGQAMAAQALAGIPSNSKLAPGKGVLSWDEYVDILRPAGELVQRLWEPTSDTQRIELYRQFLMNISMGYFLYFQADYDHPDWMPFMNSVYLAQPNPDDVYLMSRIRGTGTYRISGDRGTVHILNVSTGKNMIGIQDELGPGYNDYDFDKLDINPDGSFEVILSTERPQGYTGNWRYLHPEAEFILARQRSYDWGNEREARMAIERLDAPLLKPRMSQDETERNVRALMHFARRLSKWALDYRDRLAKQAPINTIYMGKHFSSGNSKEWDQYYWEGTYKIEPDEALIFETELPTVRPYWNAMMIDYIWNQIEYVYRQSSLNGHQARVDSDGKFRAVVSLEDPGVHNWLDTGGFTEGQIMGRWLRCNSQPLPTLKKIKFADIRKHLPADTPTISAEERVASLRARRIGAQLRRRW